MGSFAEFEREQIRERTATGLAAVARDGYWRGGPPPYGWRSVPDAVLGHRARLVLDEDEAKALRVAIDAVLHEGCSTGEVATLLNRLGLPPRRSSRWRAHMVRHLLLTLPLSGEWMWRRGHDRAGRRRRADGPPILVAVPALIDRASHERLLATLGDRSTGQRAAMRQRSYLLSRRITSRHGSPMQGVPGHAAGRYYVCRDALGADAGRGCACRRVDADAVEAAVWKEIAAVLSEPQRLVAMAETALAERAGQRHVEGGQLQALDRKIRRLEEALADRLADLLGAGIDRLAVQRATAKLDEELSELRQRRARLAAWEAANQDQAERIRRVSQVAEGVLAELQSAERSTRRRIVDLLDVRVRVTEWVPCATCKGKGLLPAPAGDGLSGRGRTGIVCPACRRGRWTPSLAMVRVLPLEEREDALDGLPFELRHAVATG